MRSARGTAWTVTVAAGLALPAGMVAAQVEPGVQLRRLASPLVAAVRAGDAAALPGTQPIRLAPESLPVLSALPIEGREGAAVRLAGVPLGAGVSADLDVQRFEAFAPGARLVAAGAGAEVELPRPDVVLLKGSVRDEPGSRVFLALSSTGANGYVLRQGRTHVISSGPGAGAEAVAFAVDAVDPATLRVTAPACGADALPLGGVVEPHAMAARIARPALPSVPATALDGPGLPPCRTAQIAVETDWEYLSTTFGGNSTAALNYVGTLFGAVSEIYSREVSTAVQVSFARLWMSNTDPYVAGTVNERLGEVSGYWAAEMGSVQRTAVHMLTGLRSGSAGGIAYLNTLCNPVTGVGVSGYLQGWFPFPAASNNWGNWDIVVVAHELGHNFGAPHTHQMNPPVDGCGSGDCAQAAQGTIMSYCHTCGGGLSNIALTLQSRVISEHILPALSGRNCFAVSEPTTVTPLPVLVRRESGQSVTLTVQGAGRGPLSYSWGVIGRGTLADGGRVSGATTASLTVTGLTPADTGDYTVRVTGGCGVASPMPVRVIVSDCYANCDGGAVAPEPNAADFWCFLSRYFEAMTLPESMRVISYANCDSSTAFPVLNSLDFSCFLQRYRAGCP